VIFVGGGTDELVGEVGESRVIDIATRLAVQTMRGISGMEIEPPLWEVDANLRPEGKQGALVRSLDSHLAYYDRWAKSWEFQALLKAPARRRPHARRGIRRRRPAEGLDERRARELRRQRAAHA
jgi:glutamine synthetase adenylyltransferase